MVYRRRLNEAGYSMLELLVCTGIVMLLCSAALPRMADMDKLYVKYETLRLMNTIRYAQTWAHQWDYSNGIWEGQPRLVVTTINNYSIRTGYLAWHTHAMEHQVKIKSNRRDIWFRPRGQTTAATIRISKGGYQERVIIDSVGRARVESG